MSEKKSNSRNWSISSELIVTEAEKMWLKVDIVDIPKNLFEISNNDKTIKFKNIDCWLNSSYAFRVAKFKDTTYYLLEREWIRVPKTKYLVRKNKDKYMEFLKDLEFPVVTKPVDWSHWDWVAVNINNYEELKEALNYSFWKDTSKVIIQEQIPWVDHRVVIVWWKMVAAALRVPPFIIWDGEKTIKELIDIENKNPLRWENHNAPLSQIKVDEEAIDTLKEQWYEIESIVEKEKKVNIRKNANLSTWWISIDLTDKVHPSVQKTCEEAAKTLTLWIAWVDFVTTDISKDIKETKWAIIEVNHTPWLRMHHYPSQGKPRNIANSILKLLFNI